MRAFLAIVLASCVTAGCCRASVAPRQCENVIFSWGGVPAAAVPEASIRQDFKLPLDPDQRKKLEQYLLAGGNNEIIGEDVVIVDALTRYAGLLDALSKPDNLDAEDLKSPTYAAWFKSAVLTQVIDARAARPNEPGSVAAVSDGPFWWVFHRVGGGKYDQLTVFRALGDNR